MMPPSHAATNTATPGQRLVASVLRRAIRVGLLGHTFRPDLPVEQQRRRLELFGRLMWVPRGACFEPSGSGGIPGMWVRPRTVAAAARTILYLHGGGYCTGSPATHRALTGHLAIRCAARVFVVDYRLAPECPFPAAVDDAVAAWHGLVGAGVAARDIVIAGDSAGGGLAVATALRLRDEGATLPRALVLFSPLADLSLEHLDAPPPGEIMLALPWLRACTRAYVGGGDVHDPLASPVEADLRGLPPTLIQVGTDEVLLPDSRRLHARLLQAGVRANLEEFPDRWHVFQVNAGVLADADRALDQVARFVAAAS